MTVADKLLADILAAPADDFPRLVLADWLEDHGQEERGKYIRAQCRKEVCRVSRDQFRAWFKPPWGHLDIAVSHQRGRTVAIGPPPGIVATDKRGLPMPAQTLVVERGFVSHAALTAEVWMKRGPQLVKRQPITDVELLGKTPLRLRNVSGWLADSLMPGISVLPSHVPDALLEWLHRAPSLNAESKDTAHYRAEFDTRLAARVALAWAAVAWARDRAGLPQLPRPEGMTP
jgi:uncharacterized protein (TIGR02996 family)